MVEVSRYDRPAYKASGVLITLGIHGGLLLFLFWYCLVTPNPPYPEGGGGPGMGIEVNLGTSDIGSGEIQEDITLSDFKNEEIPAVQSAAEETNDNLITTEDKEAESIKEIKKEEKKTLKKDVVTKKAETTTTPKETIKPEEVNTVKTPIVNTRALYKKNTNQGDAGGTGDQGNPNGNPFSNSKTGDGTGGTGNGAGAGGGTGGGYGTGTGNGVGSGISYKLDGRVIQFLQVPEKVKNKSGIVIVEVKVDKDGKVVDAIAGVKGSTTLDDELLARAKSAALRTNFKTKSDAPEFQKGTISYNFILQ